MDTPDVPLLVELGSSGCGREAPVPEVSVVVLNYNGAGWIERCLESLESQSWFGRIEVIVADNGSVDGSGLRAAEWLARRPNGIYLQYETNLGFCEGNNRSALRARGEFLFFLNNDTWLEPDCLEVLVSTVKREAADAATPVMLDYEGDTVQSSGAAGFDLFGLMSFASPRDVVGEVFVVGGCSYLIRRELFERLGGFDALFFLYAEEYDLSWRLWLSGGRALLVPQARLHHRTAALAGTGAGVGLSTSDTRRYYTNRNGLWVVAKNAQHVLWSLLPLQILLLAVEALAGWLVVGRWSFVRRAYVEALRDAWLGRGHVRAERRRCALLRRRSDWWMLRFFRLRPNRWDSFRFLRRHGLPRVTKA
jgi:GT2 family glycosyltransferase